MKKLTITFYTMLLLTATLNTIVCYGQQAVKRNTPDYRNFYGVSWRGNAKDNLAYAKQMGYDYIFYQRGMEKYADADNLYFYIETPEYMLYDRTIDINQVSTYSKDKIRNYEKRFVRKSNQSAFPDNLATGWFFNEHSFTPILDFQQQDVINWAVDSILTVVRAIEARNPNFHFGGFAWDEPRFEGDFWEGKKKVDAGFWKPKGLLEKATKKRKYTSYADGHVAFYKQLITKTKALYPNVRMMVEPYDIYKEWILPLSKITNPQQMRADVVSEEGSTTAFVTDQRIFQSGLVKKANMANTSPNIFSEDKNRQLAATAAVNGATFSWYGRFGGTGDMPNFMSPREVPARLKLIRVLTSWENGNNTPLAKRLWNNEVYTSPTAFVSKDAIAIQQPYTNKLFVVFLTGTGKIAIPAGKKIMAIYNTDDLFRETGDGSANVTVYSGNIMPTDTASLGKGFIIQLGN